MADQIPKVGDIVWYFSKPGETETKSIICPAIVTAVDSAGMVYLHVMSRALDAFNIGGVKFSTGLKPGDWSSVGAVADVPVPAVVPAPKPADLIPAPTPFVTDQLNAEDVVLAAAAEEDAKLARRIAAAKAVDAAASGTAPVSAVDVAAVAAAKSK